jgi:hypothetical protein
MGQDIILGYVTHPIVRPIGDLISDTGIFHCRRSPKLFEENLDSTNLHTFVDVGHNFGEFVVKFRLPQLTSGCRSQSWLRAAGLLE